MPNQIDLIEQSKNEKENAKLFGAIGVIALIIIIVLI